MNVIEQWFSDGQDFYIGVELLHQCGHDVRQFEPYLHENYIPTFFKEMLESLIVNLPPQPLKGELSRTPPLGAGEQTENNTIAELKQEAKMLHKRHADRHAQLHILKTKEERLPIIVEIMEEIIPPLDEIYDTIRNGGVRRNAVSRADAPQELSIEFRQGIHEGFLKAQKISYLKNRIFKLSSKNGLIAVEKDKTKREKFADELTQKQKELAALSVELGIENE